MGRDLSASLVDKLSDRGVHIADLIELHLSTPVYFTSTNINIAYNSPTAPDSGTNTYLAQGQFISFDTVTEASDLRVGTIDLTFTAVDTTTLALLLNSEYMNKRVVIYRVVLGDDYSFSTSDVYTIFDGKITSYGIQEQDRSATVKITVASLFADFERINGRKTNPTSQQLIFAGDKGLDFSPQIVKDIKWGT